MFYLKCNKNRINKHSIPVTNNALRVLLRADRLFGDPSETAGDRLIPLGDRLVTDWCHLVTAW